MTAIPCLAIAEPMESPPGRYPQVGECASRYTDAMLRLAFYLVSIALLGILLLASPTAPTWLQTPLSLYVLCVLVFLSFGIGYELGLRAPNSSESITRLFSMTSPITIVRGFFSGFSPRRSQRDHDRRRAKTSLDTQSDGIGEDLDETHRGPDQQPKE
jgi:hypothetical protein